MSTANEINKNAIGATPWTVEPHQASQGERLCVVDASGVILALTPGPLLDTDEARLRMMAAAPELLEVLEDALDYRRDAFEGDESVSGADLVEFFSIWRERAKNAIAKAEGKGGASC